MDWKRVVTLGLGLWLVPFLVSVVLFGVRADHRALFESLITVVGVTCAVAAALWYFRVRSVAGLREGVLLGAAWAATSILIDLPLFLVVFQMAPADYLADIALTYLAFPVITTGIALALQQSRAGE